MPTNAVSCNSLSHTPLALGHTESVCIIDISLNYDDVSGIPTNTRDQIRQYFYSSWHNVCHAEFNDITPCYSFNYY